jgi:hypothetical protein
MHTYIYKYRHTYTHMRITRLCYAQLCAHTWAPAHARAHRTAHTRARAHRPSRRARRPAPHRRPRRARPACAGAPPGPERAAHTEAMFNTDAVFHAPMFALNAFAERNACAPSHPRSTPTGRRSHASARMRGRPIARARTQHSSACVRRARIGDPFICVDIYIHTCRVRWLCIPGGRTHARR